MSDRERRTAFITGAASGIGRATAELFAERGWWIGAADQDVAGLESLLDGLGKEHCRVWQLDVRDKGRYDRVVAELGEETGGRLDLLFNNAGVGVAGFFEEIPLEESLRVIEVNLVGVVHGIYAALPLLKATPGSVCFSTSSSAATFGAPGLAIYTATKFAVKGLTEALAVELARCGIRVADVLPGLIDTGIFDASPVYRPGGAKADGGMVLPAAEEGPFRMIPPREVAQAVWRCCEGEDRMHWYVPEEIEEIERAKVASPEAQRDARIAGAQQMLAGS